MPTPRPSSAPTSVKGVRLLDDDSNDVRRQKLARIILDSMYQFLGLLDVEGNVIEINQAALEGAGVDLQDLVGTPFWEARWWALSEETRARVRAMVGEARTGKFVRCDIEIYGESRGSKTIIVDFSLTPIYDDQGQVAFLLPEGRNISEKIAIEAELTRKNNEVHSALERLREIDGFKTKFFANVSHELRTPLTLILGPVKQLLQQADSLSPRDYFRLETIKRNAQALLQQVNDLLDLARIDACEMPLVYACADMAALLAEIAAEFAGVAEEQQINLTLDGESSLFVDIDQAKFIRIVTNLLSNAFKFTPRGGRIRCLLERLNEERCLISVPDSGPGVPEAMKRVIFDRYAQGGEELSAKGSGLGLNIVKEFVELHLGTVSVLDAPERGALFQIELPLRAPNGAFVRPAGASELSLPPLDQLSQSRLLASPVGRATAGQAQILIVEDNPDLREFLHDVLIDDYGVSLAADGETALAAVAAQPPDLVITDLMMPEMDGEHFIRRLRQQQSANIPVLVLSARADDALRETLLAELVQDYLTKPFSPQELRARVRNLVSVKRTVDILQKELNSQASDINELTNGLINSRKSLLESLRALQISERRWLGFYENTAVGIALTDIDGKIMKANPALQKMLGYRGNEILGVSLVEISEESERALTRQNVHSLLAGRLESYQVQKRYERRDGSHLWAHVCASVIPQVDKEGPRIAVIVEDVTAQKAAEDALARTQSDLARVSRLTTMGELVASIAHEVNQPLAAIVTNSHAALRWLERSPPDTEETRAALTRAHRDAVLAGKVIARIRNFLKKGEMRYQEVNIHAMLDSLIAMLRPLLNEGDTVIRLRIAASLPQLLADPVQLQQVLMNLLVNAIEAVRSLPEQCRQEITVSVSSEDSESLLFSVRDGGPGVPPDKRAQIFDALFSTKSDGLGMGLAISRSIIESHGGTLWLDTGNETGASFSFRLPGAPHD